MGRYWLTVHWPHPVDEDADHDWFIYLQERYKAKGQLLSAGDMVAFYETAKGKAHRRKGSTEYAG
jgi:hypothetical protein